MTRERTKELLAQCKADLELAIATGQQQWALTQRDRRTSLIKLVRAPDGPAPDRPTVEAA